MQLKHFLSILPVDLDEIEQHSTPLRARSYYQSHHGLLNFVSHLVRVSLIVTTLAAIPTTSRTLLVLISTKRLWALTILESSALLSATSPPRVLAKMKSSVVADSAVFIEPFYQAMALLFSSSVCLRKENSSRRHSQQN
ncbi:hypothetical protein NE237_028721 [Protea cynaroides]|uniref:Uncharacterized protein n=1 Tax=Protea cynaroides TaxID=273540 RepID=A0A9Q0JT54_9MAGN|nr:hypothetical protein NE237_028721 [Protea cynaroides]